MRNDVHRGGADGHVADRVVFVSHKLGHQPVDDHLAELSNDPLGEQNPELTYAINHGGSVALAKAARAAGIGRFVYTSSCSVYGAASDGIKNETSAPNPQTAYARCKALVENDVSALADASFAPVFLRNATAFGASPRMRFDIVLNNLAGFAWTHVRTMLSTSLRGVVSQQLLRKTDGTGRVAALEILINTPAAANLIRQGKLDQLENIMQTGGQQGMRTMDGAIQQLFDSGQVSGAEAYKKAINKAKFEPHKAST